MSFENRAWDIVVKRHKRKKNENSFDGPHRILALSLEGDYRPALECICGYVAIGNNWRDAGEMLDDHLEQNE